MPNQILISPRAQTQRQRLIFFLPVVHTRTKTRKIFEMQIFRQQSGLKDIVLTEYTTCSTCGKEMSLEMTSYNGLQKALYLHFDEIRQMLSVNL